MAADVAGYSRLMAGDERATVAALDTSRGIFRARIESSGGRVIDMAGDSVLAVFETAAGAVSTALAVQEEINARASGIPAERQMCFRIGVHLGDIFEKADGTVYGDGVNIAARLEGLAEPGGITVSDAVHGAVRGKLAAVFVDRGEQRVKNIPHPLHAFAVHAGNHAAARPSSAIGATELSLPDKPSIAVLQFNNMSDDPSQGYFIDGMVEEIITELSRFHELFVIARNSSFTYSARAVDVRTVARELGVRYVLEGSVRKAAGRMRITAQLIDGLTGNHIWAEKYDCLLEDMFALQEELTGNIVTVIAPQIQAAEREKVKRRRPLNLSAYEIAVVALAKAEEAATRSNAALYDEALGDAKAALKIDPRSTLALAVIAAVRVGQLIFGVATDRAVVWQEGMAAAIKIIEIDPMESLGYLGKGLLHGFAAQRDQSDMAVANVRRAFSLNPHSFRNVRFLGWALTMAGQSQEAIEHLMRALRISPRDPQMHAIFMQLAQAHCFAGDYAKGVDYALRGLAEAPEFGILYGYLTMNYVGLNDLSKARTALETARRLAPGFVQRGLAGQLAFYGNDLRKATTFLRIAASLEDPSAADGLR